MKAIYICAIVVVLAINSIKAEDSEADKEKIKKACQAEVRVTDEEVEQFFENPSVINDAIKCYLKCLMEKGGMMKDGHLNVEAFLKSLESHPAFKNRQDDVIKAGDDCKQKTGSNDCETAFEIFKCLAEHEAKVFGDA